MPKLELILIRHGETDWNTGGLFRGHEDVKLNQTGIAQTEATALALKPKVFEAVYTSPLKRALVTARRIALPHEMEVKEDLAFLDMNFGAWQGRYYLFPDVSQHFNQYTVGFPRPKVALDNSSRRRLALIGNTGQFEG